MDAFAKQLEEYQARAQSWFEFLEGIRPRYDRYNDEQNATVKFVVPLFEMLGWNPLTTDMEFEYLIPGEKGEKGKVDVALFAGKSKTPKFLIEVKPFQDELDEGETQIVEYLVKSGFDYGIVTNGRELVVYSRQHVRPDYKRARKFFSLKVDDFVRYEGVLRVLSKGMIENGKFDELAKAYHSDRYWSWKKENRSGGKIHDEYRLQLEFAAKIINDAG